MKRVTWLLGPPGAGKSTYARRQAAFPRVVELTAMLGPLVDALQLRKGVLSANGAMVQAIRHVELHPENASTPSLLVVAGLVAEEALFPLGAEEEAILLLPERGRWERQLHARPVGRGSSAQYDDYAYASFWYERFEGWCARRLPITRLEIPFDEELIGKVVPG